MRPKPFVVIFLVVTVTAGLVASPVTAIRRVQVVGAQDWDESRLKLIVEHLKGVPCAMINRYSVESQAQSISAIRSASFDRNLFGSGVLTVTYQTPVARFYNHLNMALSDNGAIFQSTHLPDGIPLLEVSEAMKTYVTVADDFPNLAVARLSEQVKGMFPGQEVRIQYGTGSSICLNIGTSQVILGPSDGLDSRVAKLQAKLVSEPDFLSRVKIYNLLDPQNPMTVPKD